MTLSSTLETLVSAAGSAFLRPFRRQRTESTESSSLAPIMETALDLESVALESTATPCSRAEHTLFTLTTFAP